MGSNSNSAHEARLKVLLVTKDSDLCQSVRAAFANHSRVELLAVEAAIDKAETKIRPDQLAAIAVEFDPGNAEESAALERLARRLDERTPIVAIPATFDQSVARWLLKIRVGDFLIKPVATADLVRTVTRAITSVDEATPTEARIHTFMPASGGVGVTTLAIATAFILANEGRHKPESTCIVDLNFQYGACADYLDVEPQLDLHEIEPRPERLDRQLLEVMLARHTSGVAVIAAPPSPAEMRSFDPLLVTRLLDLVSAYFDDVVIDMPRTWFQWTENVLLGSDKLFIVGEMTVPGIRLAQRLIRAVSDRAEGRIKPEVIINRFEQRMFDSGLTRADLERALNGVPISVVPNNYRLVREAIDRGVPLDEVRKGNDVSAALKKILATQESTDAGAHKLFGALGRRLRTKVPA